MPFCRRGSPGSLSLAAGAVLLVAGCLGRGQGVSFEAVAAAGPPLVWPAAPDPPRIRYLLSIQRPADIGARRSLFRRVLDAVTGGGEDRGLVQPHGLVVDSLGRIYVADPGAPGVHMFDPGRGRYALYRSAGSEEFRSPVGITLGPDGLLYVADSELRAVVALDSNGDPQFRIDDGLLRPTGLAYDAARDRLYIVDTHRHRVNVVGPRGEPRFTIGSRGTGPGQFNFPTSLWLDDQGILYLTDALNFRVQIFGPDGRHRAGFGRHGDGVGDMALPKGLGTDRDGHIYVVEGLYDAVNVFDPAGRLLLSFGQPGRGRGEFWLATGLAVDRQNRLYVADSFNSRIQVFQYLPAVTGP